MSERIKELKKLVLKEVGYDSDNISDELIESTEKQNYLSECIGRDKRSYIWYLDGDGWEACACVETGELVDRDVIEEQLA